MSLEAQFHFILGIVAMILFVLAGLAFGGIPAIDPAADALKEGGRWLSFGLGVMALSSVMPPAKEK